MKVDGSLIAQMEASVMDYWGSYAFGKGGRHEKLGQSLFIQTTIPHPLFNSVILSGYEPIAVETTLGLAAGCVRSGGVPFLWRVGPHAESADLRAQLVKAGLQPSDPFPAMIAELSHLPQLPKIEGLEIVTANGAKDRGKWGQMAIAAFEMDNQIGAEMAACEASMPSRLFKDQPRFTGYLHGEPVAVSSLVMTQGLAGVYAVATHPKARKRGIGAAMTVHAMAEGLRRGAKMATLQATPLGRPVYEKLGFKAVFDYCTYLQS